MLNHIFFFVSDYKRLCWEEWEFGHGTGIFISVLLNDPDRYDLRDAYRFINQNPVPGIALTLKVSRHFNQELLKDIPAFFFMPNYYRYGNKYLLNLLCEDIVLSNDLKSKIIDCSRCQGVEDVLVNAVLEENFFCDETDNSVATQKRFFTEGGEFITFYSAFLKKGGVRNRFYVITGPGDAGWLYSKVKKAHKNMRDEFRALYDMAAEIEVLVNENAELAKQCSIYDAELKNFASHLAILTSGHEAKLLQDYYFNEYEILPLWYKRFGHIIKVLMGRRTFRSLFDDNVKKYKS